MASINCPRCDTELHHYVIDVVAGGGAVAGPGLTCHSCGRAISPYEVRSLLAFGSSDPLSVLRGNEAGKARSTTRIDDWWLLNKDLVLLAGGAVAVIAILSVLAAAFISTLVGIIIAVALTAVAIGIWVQDMLVNKRREKAKP